MQQRNRRPEAPDHKSAALFRWTVMLCFLVAYTYPERRRIGTNHLNLLAILNTWWLTQCLYLIPHRFQMSSG